MKIIVKNIKQHPERQCASYDSILANLGTSKQAWLELLQLNGINYIWQEMLDFLLKSDADLQEWNNRWSGNIDDLIAEISDYRQLKIKQSHAHLTLDEFVRLYQEDIKIALEWLFVERIHVCVIEKVKASGIACERIYSLRMRGKVERISGIFAFMNEKIIA